MGDAPKETPTSPLALKNMSKKQNPQICLKRIDDTNDSPLVSCTSPIGKLAPLSSSTPKPSTPFLKTLHQIPTNLKFSSIDLSIFNKQPFVSLKRISDCEAQLNMISTGKHTVNIENGSKKNKRIQPKQPVSGKTMSRTPRVTRNPRPAKTFKVAIGRQTISITERLPNDVVTTQIPSEVLHNFGISPSCQDHEPSTNSVTNNKLTTISKSPVPSSSSILPCSSSHQSLEDESSKATASEIVNEPPTVSEVFPTSTSILAPSQISENISAPITNVTSTCQLDPVDTNACSDTTGKEDNEIINHHCDLHYALTERLFHCPKIYRLEELGVGSNAIRRIAPYSLKLTKSEDSFFFYIAVLNKDAENFCCVVFGTIEHYMIAYSGYFIVPKDRIYDPVLKIPVDDVDITSLIDCRHHLCLIHIPNKLLVEFEGYFRQIQGQPHSQYLMKCVELFLHSLDQVQLKEKIRSEAFSSRTNTNYSTDHQLQPVTGMPLTIQRKTSPVVHVLNDPRTQEMFFHTNLVIDQERLDRVLKYVHPLDSIKKRYSELAILQVSCALQPIFHTGYYVGHEDSGCTSFYSTAFLLGRIEDYFVVGVLVGQSFFIMPTKRLFRRVDPLSTKSHCVEPKEELFEGIHLPLWVPLEFSSAMLEIRQIIQQPAKYLNQYVRIREALGISGLRSAITRGTFFDITSATQPRSRRLHYGWLEQVLDDNFNATFRNAPCKFPPHPACAENPVLFSENVLKLWVQRLLREIHDIKEVDISADEELITTLSQLEFFTLSVEKFSEFFLSLFGLSEQHVFQCLSLNLNGEPSAICNENLPASLIGPHVEEHHLRPLLWDDSKPSQIVTFTPFAVVFKKCDNPPLLDKCDFNLLSWARSMVEKWPVGSNQPYIKFIQNLHKMQSSQTDLSFSTTPKRKQNNRTKKRVSPGAQLCSKRKRSAEDIVIAEELKRRHFSPESNV